MAAGASAPRFKQFPFFDQSPVRDIHDLAGSPHILQNAAEISTTASSSVGMLVADIHGSVHVLDREFEPVISWVAHVGGRVTHMEERKGTLVTLGEEDTVSYPLLKVWNLEKTDKNGFPLLLRSVKIQQSSRRSPVSCVALANGLAALAVGLGDGTVLLYRHFDQSVFSSSTSLTALPKPRTVHESASEPATGLGFREPTAETPSLYLFIATLNRVLSYQASGRGSGSSPIEVHEVGAALSCAVIDWRAHDLFVARDEAIYVCGVEGRGSSFAVEGPKLFVRVHRNYLVIITPPVAPSAASASVTIRNAVSRGAANSTTDIGKVTVFDPENKFVAFSDTFASGIRAVVSQWDNLYVLTNNGTLFCLQEKPTPDKLGMLYQRQQHPLALSIAKTQNLDEASVADIHRQYGDHLYGRGDYDGAMVQYLQTIGNVQPSYVIRKFLDAQRIHNLVTYLQELHALGLANADHTTLLLNTYTKLKDVARLDSFIKTESRRGDDTGELPFDLDTAIRVCRQAGYFEHASYLARRWERHEDYLRIQIEDARNYKEALVYLRRLGPSAAEHNLARYGRKMLEALPEQTTQLLIDICTNPALLTAEPEELSPTPAKQGQSYLSYLALNRGSASDPPQAHTSSDAPAPKSVDAGSRKGSVHEGSRASTSAPDTPPTASGQIRAVPAVLKRPSPRLYFANFVGHRSAFVTFLEAVARKRWGQALDTSAPLDHLDAELPADEAAEHADQVAVWNTLLELYLSEGLTTKAYAVLENERIPYDPTHALILCTTRSFTRGLVLLWEHLGMHEDVLRFWMDRARAGEVGAGAEVMRCLEKHGSGPAGRYLYPLTLRFLTESAELMGRHRTELERVLREIQVRAILPPLAVVQILSRNGVTSVGVVKEWLLARIHEAREEIQTDQQLTDSYRLETNAKMKKVAELSDPDHPRNFHVTQCANCGGQLDLPSIHFMCGHSYHARCLVNNETECLICARDHAIIRDIRRNNERLADQHDVFVAEVQENGFSAIAAGFGRGVFNVPRAEDVVVR